MVIDIKDDFGYITYVPDEDSELASLDIGKPYIKDPHAMLKELEEKQIYPIGRIVVFKDSVLAEKRPDLSFMDGDTSLEKWTRRIICQSIYERSLGP